MEKKKQEGKKEQREEKDGVGDKIQKGVEKCRAGEKDR